MKNTVLTLLIALCSIASKAQSLKITSVDSVDPNKYQEFASEHLGKYLNLSFYDNALKIEEANMPTLYLKKIGDDKYEFEEDNSQIDNTIVIEVRYTVGVVTSLTLTAVSHDKNGGYTNTITAVAKRF